MQSSRVNINLSSAADGLFCGDPPVIYVTVAFGQYGPSCPMTHEIEDMKELLIRLVRALADNPDAVSIEITRADETIVLKLRVAPADVAKVVGQQGRTARSLRAILATFGMKANRKYRLEIVDED